MKIVELINSLNYRGGAQVLFYNLCKHMCQIENVELHIVLTYDGIDDSFNDLFTLENVTFYTCQKKNSLDIGSSFRLRKIINSIKPDIVNFHLGSYINYFFAFGFRRKKWRVIKTFHSIPGKDTNRVNLFFEKQYIKKGLISFIGISQSITNEAIRLYKKIDIVTIENGIDLPQKSLEQPKVYDLINVASFEPVKNHKLLFDTMKELLIIYPEATLVCLGNGSLFDWAKEYVKKLNIENNVFFAGNVSNVYEYLNKSSCFILTSTNEGNPISILEAMASGLPVIAPSIGGIPDVVINGHNGVLFKVNDQNDLLESMKRVLLKEDDHAFYRENNLKRIQQFSIEKTASQYVDFFTKKVL